MKRSDAVLRLQKIGWELGRPRKFEGLWCIAAKRSGLALWLETACKKKSDLYSTIWMAVMLHDEQAGGGK